MTVTYSQALQKSWRYPNLWNGRVWSVCPTLQGGGKTLIDFAGNNAGNMSLNNMSWNQFYNTINPTAATSTAIGYVGGPVGNYAAPFSIACWFYVSTLTPSGYLMMLNNAGVTTGANWFGIYTNSSNVITIGIGVGSVYSVTGATLTANTWYCVVATFSATNVMTMYVNANSGGTGGGSLVASTGNLNRISLGCWGGYGLHAYTGALFTDAAVWNRVLSAGEARQLYRLGPTGSYAQRPQPYNYAAAVASTGDLLSLRRRRVLA
jgi:hypothetical protein